MASNAAQSALANVNPEMQLYLSTRSQKQLEELMAAINALIPATKVSNSKVQKTSKVKHMHGRATTSINPTAKAKRPLNSWIAFRAYYRQIFKSYQQKYVSGFLKCLWDADPFTSKWAFLAQAYSIMRDSGATIKPHLEDFLTLCCPQIMIIPPEHYLSFLGWEFGSVEGQETLTRLFTPGKELFEAFPATTGFAVEDVLKFCKDMGMYSGNVASHIGEGSMMVVAAPGSTHEANVQESQSNEGQAVVTPIEAGHSDTFDENSLAELLNMHNNGLKVANATDMVAHNVDMFNDDKHDSIVCPSEEFDPEMWTPEPVEWDYSMEIFGGVLGD